MIKFNTVSRLFFSFGVFLLLAESALAQSVLNFSRTTLQTGSQASLSVMNPTSYWADVQFTLYGLDGTPALGLVNPVNYRVAPKGQLSMLATDVFAGTNINGWIQAASPTSDLRGFYFAGNLQNEVEGAEAADSFTQQVIPFVRNEQLFETDVVLVNPGVTNASVTVTFFNASGTVVGTQVQTLSAHAARRFKPQAAATGILSARIDSSVPVSATAVARTHESLLFIPGQSVNQPAATRIASHFLNGGGYNPTVVLNNPNSSPVSVTITLSSPTGGSVYQSLDGPSRRTISIPAYGSASVDTVTLTGIAFAPLVENGWLRIDSGNVTLTGLVILDQAEGISGIPLEAVASTRILYPQTLTNDSTYSGIALINPSLETAQVDLFLVNDEGTTLAEKRIELLPNTKLTALVPQLLPAAINNPNGFVMMRASRGIYGVGLRGSNRFLASVGPMDLPANYFPDRIPLQPRINRLDPGIETRPGSSLRVSATNVGNSVSFLIGNQVAASRAIFPGSPTFDVDVPNLEPGFVPLRVRSDGVDSPPVFLEIPPADNLPRQILSGQAFYQKVEVNDGGLDLGRLSMVPVRNARVEVVDRSLQAVVSVSETDAQGRFRVPVPFEPDLTVRVLSRLRSAELRVADNTNGNGLYAVSAAVDGRTPETNLLLVDNTRNAGAFNVLELIQRGNDLLKLADSSLTPPNVTVFWSASYAGPTFFRLRDNTAYIKGERTEDSDEFDDAVIVHEYAHMLAVRFSRDDSPGGAHSVGDMLDPRIAWSEGWANFFSSAVRNDAIYRDSGPNGTRVRYDLEENIPPGDRPGYWSESSIQSLLWDLFDDRADTADNVQFAFRAIWNAFTDLRNDRFVYLPYFLEHFLARSPESDSVLRVMVQQRSIDFQPNVRPSVTTPFPLPMNVGESVRGDVDSLTLRRDNLMTSSHFRSFTTSGGAASIRLEIIGLGPANNPNANDLDLFVMDANGRIIDQSDRGLNGQSELISVRLPAGTYVVEVRSFYRRAETNELVFSSGTYRLGVNVQ